MKVGWAWSAGVEISRVNSLTGNPLEGTEPGTRLRESLSQLFGLIRATVELCSHLINYNILF